MALATGSRLQRTRAPTGVPETADRHLVPMPSTHLSLHYHVVFSTKGRAPLIVPAWRERMHAYLGGVVRSVEGIPEIIGGVADHVHLLLGLRAAACLADVVRDVKAVSSRWVHEEIGDRAFTWQEATAHSPSVRRNGPRSARTSRGRRSTIGGGRFRKSTSNSWNAAAWNTTRGICGEGARFRRPCRGGVKMGMVPVAVATG